jgi:hypothetical protein
VHRRLLATSGSTWSRVLNVIFILFRDLSARWQGQRCMYPPRMYPPHPYLYLYASIQVFLNQ